jgi:thiamine monophosphate synthase
MRLEDALLYLILDAVPAVGIETFCEAAIAGGVDAIQLGPALCAEASVVRDVCARDDALFIVSDRALGATGNQADGVLIHDASLPIGQYRGMMADGAIVGMATRSRNDALLALEMGVDYVLHWEGILSPATFAALPGAAGNALFAAGLTGIDDARRVVDAGVYRLCIEASVLNGDDVTESAAAFSRLLGRSI